MEAADGDDRIVRADVGGAGRLRCGAGELTPRHAARTDANQAEIIEAIRLAGYFVCNTSRLGEGFPDILCVNHQQQVILFEIKTAAGRLTEAELRFQRDYPGLLFIVRSAEMALEYLGMRW